MPYAHVIEFPAAGSEEMAAALAGYAQMVRVRRFEEKLGQLVAMGVIHETEALATNKEAMIVGLVAAAAGLPVVSCTGHHGLLVCRGAPLIDLFRELMLGRGVVEVGSYLDTFFALSPADAVASAVVRWAEIKRPVLVWLGAVTEPDARLSQSLANAQRTAAGLLIVVDEVDGKINALGQPHVVAVDGMDAGKIASASRELLAGLASGPKFIAARTRRFRGHLVARPGSRQPPREETDAIARTRARLIADYGVGEAQLKAIERAERDAVSAACSEARTALELDTGG